MVSPFGMYGGGGSYASPEARALSTITPTSYDWRDQGKVMSKLVSDVSFMAGMQRKMQKGIDDANQNFIQQIQSLLSDILSLISGSGGDTGLDFGDLKYILEAIGALFGFGDGVLPINLFSAAWHFFSEYILPVDNFQEVIDEMVDSLIGSVLDIFGTTPIVGQALEQLAVIISQIRDALDPIIIAVNALFTAIGGDSDTGDLGPFGALWDSLSTMFGTITAPVAALLAPIFVQISTWTAPFIDGLTSIVEVVTNIINMLTGGVNSIDDFIGGTFNPVNIILNLITALIDNGLSGVGGEDWADLVLGLFGVSGGDQSTFNQLGTNLMSFLGGINLNTGSFDLFGSAQQFLQNVLTPSGALTTWTQLPQHLFGNLQTGSGTNLFPDPSFDDAGSLDGLGGLWDWSSTGRTKAGSAHTTANGSLKDLIGIPIKTVEGDITILTGYLKWTSVTSTAGQKFKLCANAYDENDFLISDANRIVASITAPGADSGTYSGNTSGWVKLMGQHQAPAGTSYVRFCLEIDATCLTGDIYLDDCVHTLDSGMIDANFLKNLENFTGKWDGTNVGGFQGIEDLIATLGHYTDGLGSAFTQGGGLSNVDLTTLFNLATNQTNNAITANFQAALHTLILGNRTNKSAGFGANPTSQGSLTVDAYSSAGALTTQTVAAGQAVGHIWNVPEFATYGYVDLQLSIPAGTNDVRVNIYKVNTTTSPNAKTALFNSADIHTQIGTANSIIRILLPSMPQVQASDQLVIEFANNSATNALTTVFKATAIPNNTNDIVQNTGWTRAISAGGVSPASLTSAQGSYSGNVPYMMIGITNVPANYQPPQQTPYLASGSYAWAAPTWQSNGDIVELVGCGAGGGGGGSFNFVGGQGGRKGIWNSVKLIVGTDIKLGSSVGIVIGTEGSGGSSILGDGTAGTSTTFVYQDPAGGFHTLTCAGGAGGANGGNDLNGESSGNYTFDNLPYFGGAAVGSNAHGNVPGGGGGGGFSYTAGATGSDGSGWVLAKQP